MQMIVSQSVGFFVQFFPCAALALLAFDNISFRITKKYVMLYFALYSAVASILFSIVQFAAPKNADMTRSRANAIFFAAAMILFAVYMLIVKESAVKKIMSLCFVIYYASIVYLLSNILSYFLDFMVKENYVIYQTPFLIIMTVISALIFPIFCFLIKNTVKKYFTSMDPKNIKIQFAVCVFLTVCELLSLMIHSVINGETYTMVFPFVSLQHMILIITMLVYYWAILGLSIKIVNENQLNKQLEIRRLQYEHITEEIESAKRTRHDIRHLANVIIVKLSDGKTDEALEIIKNFSDKTENTLSEKFCMNENINTILRYYIGKARQKGIRCDVNAQCAELDIDVLDMAVILGNLLENAIHSCEKTGTDQSFIYMKIGTVGTFLAIQIDNSCSSVRLAHGYKNQTGYLPAEAYESTHEGKGYGLSNTEFAALKYGGSASFLYSEETHVFSSRIRLNKTPNTDFR